MQYPCSGEIHTCGTLLSGCVWSLRNELLATNPSTYRDILSSLTIGSVRQHTNSSSIDPGITTVFMTLDDNDANINNGTPHYPQIQAAFSAHSMPGPTISSIVFSYPSGHDPGRRPAEPASRCRLPAARSRPARHRPALSYNTGAAVTIR
jgi:hypothetical protein